MTSAIFCPGHREQNSSPIMTEYCCGRIVFITRVNPVTFCTPLTYLLPLYLNQQLHDKLTILWLYSNAACDTFLLIIYNNVWNNHTKIYIRRYFPFPHNLEIHREMQYMSPCIMVQGILQVFVNSHGTLFYCFEISSEYLIWTYIYGHKIF